MNTNDVKAQKVKKVAKQVAKKSNSNDEAKGTLDTNANATSTVEKNIHLKKRATPKKFARNFTFCHDPDEKSNLDEDTRAPTQGQVVDAQ